MNETICAKVNTRLLSKADRLFTGTVEGRIIELLQNARRAGATEVVITNEGKTVTIRDNGNGIDDFQKLLDLGGSGWGEKLDAGEDPAGVGLFSLVPREVTIISGSKQVVIDSDGWTGKPVCVETVKEALNGTMLRFSDDRAWDKKLVEKYAVFSGLKVVVDGHLCQSMDFCSKDAVLIENLGCRIEVVKEISTYHQEWTQCWYDKKVLVNYHGQVIEMDYWPGKSNQKVTILVDLDQQTDIRLMLPARTRLVENTAFIRLQGCIECHYYKYFDKLDNHNLSFAEWQRARQLSVQLKEAEPCYVPGVLWDEYEMAAEIVLPKDFNLKDAYLCNDEDIEESSRANVHLLGAQGVFKGKPFVPVRIKPEYHGYSWSKLPTVTDVKVDYGKELLSYGIGAEVIVCFDKLAISLKTSDGEVFSSDVDLAVLQLTGEDKRGWDDDVVAVTKDARKNLNMENIWYHMGGYNMDGDSYETQQYDFEKDLDEFWNGLIGPYENLRESVQESINRQYGIYDKWKCISYDCEGVLKIEFKDGSTEIVHPPKTT